MDLLVITLLSDREAKDTLKYFNICSHIDITINYQAHD
jgi:hypothetical protein